MKDITTIMNELQKPFKTEEIGWRITATSKNKDKGLAVAYVTNRAIQNRLDDVVTPLDWKNEFKEWHEKKPELNAELLMATFKDNTKKLENILNNYYTHYQLCGISIWDDEKKQWITKWDGSDESQTESTKGGLSGSMKRAAYQWGIGRYLYNLPSTWVKIEPQGRSYRMIETPKLPGWALPGGYIENPDTTPISRQEKVKLFSLAKGNNDIVKQVLAKFGHIKTDEIIKSEYAAICNEIKKQVGN